jgi:hypothetical protein
VTHGPKRHNLKAPTHQSDRGGGGGRDGGGGHGGDQVFSHQQRGGSDQFEKSRKHNIVNDASIISSGRRSVTFGSGIDDEEEQQAR